jgi:hypothetical protein
MLFRVVFSGAYVFLFRLQVLVVSWGSTIRHSEKHSLQARSHGPSQLS